MNLNLIPQKWMTTKGWPSSRNTLQKVWGGKVSVQFMILKHRRFILPVSQISSKHQKVHFLVNSNSSYVTKATTLLDLYPAGIYLFKVNNGNTKTMCEIFLVTLLLTLNRFHTLIWYLYGWLWTSKSSIHFRSVFWKRQLIVL